MCKTPLLLLVNFVDLYGSRVSPSRRVNISKVLGRFYLVLLGEMRTQAIAREVTCTPILTERVASGAFYWARVQTVQTIMTIERRMKHLLCRKPGTRQLL